MVLELGSRTICPISTAFNVSWPTFCFLSTAFFNFFINNRFHFRFQLVQYREWSANWKVDWKMYPTACWYSARSCIHSGIPPIYPIARLSLLECDFWEFLFFNWNLTNFTDNPSRLVCYRFLCLQFEQLKRPWAIWDQSERTSRNYLMWTTSATNLPDHCNLSAFRMLFHWRFPA